MKRLVISLALLAATQAYAQNTVKPGLWEVNNKVKTGNPQADEGLNQAMQMMENMPPEQRKQIAAMMAKQGMSMPTQGSGGGMLMTVCVTPEMAARKELPLNQKGKCTSTQDQVAGGINFAYSCTDPVSSGKGQLRFQGDSAYTMTMQLTNLPGTAMKQTTIESTGRRVSPTCPATPAPAPN